MSHRAGLVVDAVAEAITARVQASGCKVFTHRRESLSTVQDELPAISVDYGEDDRADSVFIGSIDSVLNVLTTALVEGDSAAEVRTDLLEWRREIHRAVMADPRFGMQSVVVRTLYDGAEAPEIQIDESERVVGRLTSSWLVYYRMDPADPGSD